MNALAAEIALVLHELSTELILTQHIQGVLSSEADTLGRWSQGASILESLITAACLFLPARDYAFYDARATQNVRHLCQTHCSELCVLASFTCRWETRFVLLVRTA